MAQRRRRVGNWDAPQRLKAQLDQLENDFLAFQPKEVPANVDLDSSLVIPGNVRTLTVPDRDVNLGERHRLDPWIVVADDFCAANIGTTEFYGSFISAEFGVAARSNPTDNNNPNHPGYYTVTSAAQTGGVTTIAGRWTLAGAEYGVCVFRTPPAYTGRVFKCGFIDTTALVEPVNGVYWWMTNSGVLNAKTSVASVRVSALNPPTLDVSTWYTVLFKIANDGSGTVFRLYNDLGIKLWEGETVATVPKAAALYGGLVQGTTGALSVDCGSADYLEYRVGGPKRPLVRYLGSAEDLFT